MIWYCNEIWRNLLSNQCFSFEHYTFLNITMVSRTLATLLLILWTGPNECCMHVCTVYSRMVCIFRRNFANHYLSKETNENNSIWMFWWFFLCQNFINSEGTYDFGGKQRENITFWQSYGAYFLFIIFHTFFKKNNVVYFNCT